ncbi:universal stress protein [Sporolituus thermophilus]|uniref:Nucleotide-binding universal stress protein, UspA family n=1 Tax=Sporolituus thermophilus DSM 23256 TaxID=1123285 RepID=A0A1G7LY88_9FIRM|nr:universal stress protein [Sporolituus thermophilus]SDF53909.1 Nucleotide-binding universal stress protein, UspA family [Sporolituus thermophilus DSM 23256]
MDVKKIVVAYDGSKQSQKGLEWAVAMSAKFGAEVIAVTVVKPPEFSPTISEIDEFYAYAEKHYQPMLEKVRKYGEEYGVPVKTELLRGHPAESIVKYAFEKKADLIVTGTRGMGGFKNLVIGSVAQKVVSYSQVPVLVVK